MTDLEDLLDCSVCNQQYDSDERGPCTLNCGHTFCRNCLMGMAKDKKSIQCPACRKEATWETEPTINFHFRDLAELIKAQRSSIHSPSIERRSVSTTKMTMCSQHNELIPDDQLRVCIMDDCSREPICAHCVCDGPHSGHKTEKYVPYRVRNELRRQMEQMRSQMTESKNNIMEKIGEFQKLHSNLQKGIREVDIHPTMIKNVETVLDEEEAFELRQTANELKDLFLESCDAAAKAIQDATEAINAQMSNYMSEQPSDQPSDQLS